MIFFIEMNLLSCVMPRERRMEHVCLFVYLWVERIPTMLHSYGKNPKHKKNIHIKLAGERTHRKRKQKRKQQKASVRVKSLFGRYDSYESNKRSTKVRSDRREKAYNTFLIVMVSSLKDSEGQAQPLQHSTHATNKGPALQLGLCESARRVGRRLQNAASYVSGGTKCHIYMPGCLDSPSMNRTRGEIGPGGTCTVSFLW
mmetsp:Transcript_33172/g.48695  ORF Transcript_33172/g.48695 Transcript_33172/m.48695 type:complete len:200 (+) Transcript_33172:1001-1600(+)